MVQTYFKFQNPDPDIIHTNQSQPSMKKDKNYGHWDMRDGEKEKHNMNTHSLSSITWMETII